VNAFEFVLLAAAVQSACTSIAVLAAFATGRVGRRIGWDAHMAGFFAFAAVHAAEVAALLWMVAP
jgi:hypothetical protein